MSCQQYPFKALL